MTKKEDPVVLSYYDCLIRESDIKILKGNGWLNDAIIGFYFVYLEKSRFHLNNEVLFIGPEVTQCLKESPSSELSIFLDPLEVNVRSFIFMAVNDSGKSAGGSHWSLLVYCKLENKFYHVDSSAQTNYYSAMKLAHNIGQYVSPLGDIDLVELMSLQQDNSFDCGIYLVCNLENIADHVIHGGTLCTAQFIKKETVNKMRKDIIDLIDECKKEV